MKNRNTFYLIVGATVIASALILNILQRVNPPQRTLVTDFASCAAAGYPIMESYPRQCASIDGRTFREVIKEPDLSDAIQVAVPRPNDTIVSPLTVTGKARGSWYFEASFPVKLVDAEGKVLGQTAAQAQGEWMTNDFVPFIATIPFTVSSTTDAGELLLDKDNPSGLPQNAAELKIPVRFSHDVSATSDTMDVIAYFNTPETGADPEFDCKKVFPVVRHIPRTDAPARAALEELLKGPTVDDQRHGFVTSINAGVEIQKLMIVNGVASVDFNDQLEYQVGGSCRVAAIRSQIDSTLKQFPTVTSVVVSINGRTEDILQP